PIIGSFYLGFTDWDLLRTPKFIGLSNFSEALSDPGLIRIVVNTVLFSIIYVIGVMVIGLFLALMVNQKLPGTNFFRAAYYLPVITSAVAIGIIWSWILSPQVGILNILVKSVGLKPPNWLGDTHWALLTVSVIQVWKMAGYYMVLFLAGLQSIPDSVKEAAVVDGANSLQLFFHVTLPMLSPTTFFVLTVAMIDSFKNFELIYTMTRGGPQSSTTTLVYDVYVYGFVHYRMGYASAVAYVLMVLVGAITIANFYIKKRWVTNSYY
ncbi:MAG TPA: sugar ABC transporter permease, partial [Rectinema sp.]|nr:sugar ABC transporter permease [Rectinema sp.]HPW01298.1 sugar ABC transporter permease [Rectinema sp.]